MARKKQEKKESKAEQMLRESAELREQYHAQNHRALQRLKQTIYEEDINNSNKIESLEYAAMHFYLMLKELSDKYTIFSVEEKCQNPDQNKTSPFKLDDTCFPSEAPEAPPLVNIVEIGCGTVHNKLYGTIPLHGFFGLLDNFKYLGLDVEKESIDDLKRLFYGEENVMFRQVDATNPAAVQKAIKAAQDEIGMGEQVTLFLIRHPVMVPHSSLTRLFLNSIVDQYAMNSRKILSGPTAKIFEGANVLVINYHPQEQNYVLRALRQATNSSNIIHGKFYSPCRRQFRMHGDDRWFIADLTHTIVRNFHYSPTSSITFEEVMYSNIPPLLASTLILLGGYRGGPGAGLAMFSLSVFFLSLDNYIPAVVGTSAPILDPDLLLPQPNVKEEKTSFKTPSVLLPKLSEPTLRSQSLPNFPLQSFLTLLQIPFARWGARKDKEIALTKDVSAQLTSHRQTWENTIKTKLNPLLEKLNDIEPKQAGEKIARELILLNNKIDKQFKSISTSEEKLKARGLILEDVDRLLNYLTQRIQNVEAWLRSRPTDTEQAAISTQTWINQGLHLVTDDPYGNQAENSASLLSAGYSSYGSIAFFPTKPDNKFIPISMPTLAHATYPTPTDTPDTAPLSKTLPLGQ